MLGYHLVLDVPKLLGEVNVIVVRVCESSHLVPHTLYLFRTVTADLVDRGKLVNEFSFVVYSAKKLCCGIVGQRFTLPDMLRIEKLDGLGVIYCLVINAEQVCLSLAGFTVSQAVKLFEVGGGYLSL